MGAKRFLKQGYRKVQKVIIIEKDVNGKEHFLGFNTMEEAKNFDSSAEKRLITFYEKDLTTE